MHCNRHADTIVSGGKKKIKETSRKIYQFNQTS